MQLADFPSCPDFIIVVIIFYNCLPDFFHICFFSSAIWGCLGRMVVGFITTNAISAYHHYVVYVVSHSGEVYSYIIM